MMKKSMISVGLCVLLTMVFATVAQGTFTGKSIEVDEGNAMLDEQPVTAATYHGNTKSKIFHSSGCRYYNCKACTAVFRSRQAAIDAGYRPCKKCRP